jgi:hypothetical protein
MDHIMLDIETLGNKSTSVILSIGAVTFDIDSNATGEAFHVFINIDSALKAGLTVDASTICWWMTQSEEAREIFNTEAVAFHLPAALALFTQWLQKQTRTPIVWANGSNFDIPILENAFHAVDMSVPWQYYNVRDYRTIKNVIPPMLFDAIRVYPMVPHNAAHDALAQAQTLQNIFALSGNEQVPEQTSEQILEQVPEQTSEQAVA